MDVAIQNLSKSYGPQRAVDQISFVAKKGEILGFLGPNGAGKTTTMKMITNYIAIESGDIQLGGKSVKTHADELKRSIGYLPEHNPLYLEMPVIDYLAYCAALQGIPSKDIPARIREMIRICGLNQEKHKKISELSKGYRQRVGLAQAMIHDPEILILDEPTSGLDPNQIVEIRKLIKHIGKEKTVILSTHILSEVEATCDRILIINKGKIVADGSAENLRSQARAGQIHTLCIEDGEQEQIIAAISKLEAVEKVHCIDQQLNRYKVESQEAPQLSRQLFKLCVDKGWVLTEMSREETKLEDIFRQLTN